MANGKSLMTPQIIKTASADNEPHFQAELEQAANPQNSRNLEIQTELQTISRWRDARSRSVVMLPSQQFAEDMNRYLDGLPVRARRKTVLHIAPTKFINRNKLRFSPHRI